MSTNEIHPGYRLESIPEAPDTLSEGARQEWKTMAPTVFDLQTARPADLRAMEFLCEVLADVTLLQETIRTEGFTVEAGSGGRKGHPAMASLERARTRAKGLLDRFGLLPGSKTLRAPKYSADRYPYNQYDR